MHVHSSWQTTQIPLDDKLIPLLWQYLCFGCPSQFSVFWTPTAIGTAACCVPCALEPGIAPKTAVLCRRPPKFLLGHPPKRTTFYMECRQRKLTKCVYCSHVSVAFAAGLNKTLAQPNFRPPNLGTRPSKPKTSFGRKVHDYKPRCLSSVT